MEQRQQMTAIDGITHITYVLPTFASYDDWMIMGS
jgi:hypothetical protein